jgi:crossover junction endodeoxyribonuclease RuvC
LPPDHVQPLIFQPPEPPRRTKVICRAHKQLDLKAGCGEPCTGTIRGTSATAMQKSQTRILGLDPGLRNLGWGVVDWDEVRLAYVACGTIATEAHQPIGARLAVLFRGLEGVLASLTPAEAAVEETFVNGNARSALKLGQARGIALLVPAQFGLSIAEYAPNAVKKTVTGSGHADKEQIRAMLRYLLPKAAPGTADAADALAVAITHAHHRRSRSLAARYAVPV